MKAVFLRDGSKETNNKILVRDQLHCVRWVLETCLGLLIRFLRMILMQDLEKWWHNLIII